MQDDVDDDENGGADRIMIQKESLVTKSMTDNGNSMIDVRNRELNLTEYERQVRLANGLPVNATESKQSQLEPVRDEEQIPNVGSQFDNSNE